MKVGLSLPTRYLRGVANDGGNSGFPQWVGEPDMFLDELKQHGVNSVEIQGVAPGSFDNDLLRVMRRVAGAGMGFTFHSHLPGASGRDPEPFPCPDTIAFLKALKTSPIIVVHAHQTAGVCPNALVKSSVQGLRALLDTFRQNTIPIRVAVEINRYCGVDSPGVTYDGLLEILKPFTDDDVGFCWDMGHTQSSVLQKKLSSVPPSEFMSRVIHAHVHDLSPEGETHWPLTEYCPHLASSIRRLESQGYTGVYNLELYPERWGAEEHVKNALLRSVVRLLAIGHEAIGINFTLAPS